MERKDVPTKIIAFAGTLLVWFPILAPVVISVARFVSDRRFRFDYLIPAELFPLALAGGGLLLWAALRVHSRQKLIALGTCLCDRPTGWQPGAGGCDRDSLGRNRAGRLVVGACPGSDHRF